MPSEKFVLPADVEIVPFLHYAKNDQIGELVVPEGVKVLGAKAFSACTNLRTVHLPRSLTNIDMKCFEKGCLEDVYYAGSRYDWNQIEISPTGSQALLCKNLHFAETDLRDEVRYEPDEGDKELLFSQVRSLLDGGDGRFHIVAPELCVEGVCSKPGDMSLLIFPEGSTMLIDTGYLANFEKVQAFLTGIGLKRLDYFVFSHCDGDHVSNAQAIADMVLAQPGGRIGQFLSTGQIFGQYVPSFFAFLREQGIPLDMQVRAGRVFHIDGVKLEILGPTDEDMTMDVNDGTCRNNQSMIMKFTYGNASYLTAGDLYETQEAEVVRRYGEKLKVDVWKSNHHGAFTSNTPVWMDAVGGKIMFSLANDNGETPLTLRAQARDIQCLSTGCHGLIWISAGMDGSYQLRTQYHNGLRMFQRPQYWKFDQT